MGLRLTGLGSNEDADRWRDQAVDREREAEEAKRSKELLERDAWIAEHVMSLERVKKITHLSCSNQFFWNQGDVMIHFRGNEVRAFRPTINSADAMEVLKKCAEKVWAENSTMTKCQHYKIEIWNNGLWVVMQSEKLDTAIESETIELAICLFAQKLFSTGNKP